MARRGQLGAVSTKLFTPEFLATTSSVKTPVTTADWLAFTGNSVTLTNGLWIVHGMIDFGNSGDPAYNVNEALWGTANGADSAAEPTRVSTQDAGPVFFNFSRSGGTTFFAKAVLNLGPIRMTVSSDFTIFANGRAGATTIANARVTAFIYAERIA